MDFSVLLSVYYREKSNNLRESLDSILQQTLLPSEIVLVKDGPLSEELDKVIDEYEANFPILKVVSLAVNQGLGIALNEGLKYCTFNYVARMDTDDIAVPERFEMQIHFLESHPDISVVGGWIKEFELSTVKCTAERRPPIKHELLMRYMKFRNPFNHMTVMFYKPHVELAGGYQPFYLLEDYYLWTRMLLKGYRFANIPITLVYARGGMDMLSRRGGRRYVKSEYKLLSFFYSERILGLNEYICSIVLKSIVRLGGCQCRKLLYKYFLR